jgi:hypothetical protein
VTGTSIAAAADRRPAPASARAPARNDRRFMTPFRGAPSARA